MSQTFTRTLTTSRGLAVQAVMSDDEAILKLRSIPSNFGSKLLFDFDRYKKLSVSQMAWVHKLVNEDGQPVQPRLQVEIGSMSALIEMFDTAQRHLKYPKIRLTFNTAQFGPLNLCLSVAGASSKTPGAINVTDGGKYGSNRYFGRISREGKYEERYGNPPELVGFLRDFCARPAEMAAEYGLLSGNCCFCNATLTDERSTAAGFGPTCAKHFGLSWGKKAVETERELILA